MPWPVPASRRLRRLARVSFVDLFEAEDPEPPLLAPPVEYERPVWIGPPEDELGAAVPLGQIVGRSDRGVVAISHALVYSSGLSFDLQAQVEGLRPDQSNLVFHEQHHGGVNPEELSDGFLRFGVELPDGARVSNLGLRRRWANPAEGEPDSPVLSSAGGSGGTTSAGRSSLQQSYWLWPLPQDGTLRLFCEWPIAAIGLTSVDVEARSLRDAAASVVKIWPNGDGAAPMTDAFSSSTLSIMQRHAGGEKPSAEGEDAAISATQIRSVRKALLRAVDVLDRL